MINTITIFLLLSTVLLNFSTTLTVLLPLRTQVNLTTNAFRPAIWQKSDSELSEKDEIRRTFTLATGARVNVSSIRGSVDIETADTNEAQVHIVRSARRRTDLEQHKIIIENSPQYLTIRGEQRRPNSGSGPDVRHRVVLKLPRNIGLSVRSVSGNARIDDLDGPLTVLSVSGSLNVGAVNGPVEVTSVSGNVDIGPSNQRVEIKSVSGSVRLGQATGSLEVSSVSGSLYAGISRLGPRGVQVNSVSGSVELRFTGKLNAQLSTTSVSGKVTIELPEVTLQNSLGAGATQAMIGKGGPPISITGVSGRVRLVPATGSSQGD